jgi:hypothetical protein
MATWKQLRNGMQDRHGKHTIGFPIQFCVGLRCWFVEIKWLSQLDTSSRRLTQGCHTPLTQPYTLTYLHNHIEPTHGEHAIGFPTRFWVRGCWLVVNLTCISCSHITPQNACWFSNLRVLKHTQHLGVFYPPPCVSPPILKINT